MCMDFDRSDRSLSRKKERQTESERKFQYIQWQAGKLNEIETEIYGKNLVQLWVVTS